MKAETLRRLPKTGLTGWFLNLPETVAMAGQRGSYAAALPAAIWYRA